jgi:hypothetical protein
MGLVNAVHEEAEFEGVMALFEKRTPIFTGE